MSKSSPRRTRRRTSTQAAGKAHTAEVSNLEAIHAATVACPPVGCKIVPAALPDRFIEFGLRLAQHDWSLHQLLAMIEKLDADTIMQRLNRGQERQIKGDIELVEVRRDGVVYADGFGVVVPIESQRSDQACVVGRLGRERVELLVRVDSTGPTPRRVRVTVERLADPRAEIDG